MCVGSVQHSGLFDTLWSLLTLLRSGDRDIFCQIFTSAMMLVEGFNTLLFPNMFFLIDEGRILFCSHFLADLIFKLVSLTMATTGFCRSCLSCFVLCCSNKLHHVHICFFAMLFGGIFCNPEWIRGRWLWILASIVQNSLLLDPSTGPWTAH